MGRDLKKEMRGWHAAIVALALSSVTILNVDGLPSTEITPLNGHEVDEQVLLALGYPQVSLPVSFAMRPDADPAWAQHLLGEGRAAGSGAAGGSAGSGKQKIHNFKVTQTMKKIEEVVEMKDKKRKHPMGKMDPEEEQHLANQLVTIEEIAADTKSDKEIEHAVARDGPKRFHVEINLRKWKVKKEDRKKRRSAKEKEQKKLRAEKLRKAKEMAEENKHIERVTKRYEKSSVPARLREEVKEASAEAKQATVISAAKKANPAVKDLSKKYHLDHKTDTEFDYPAAPVVHKGNQGPQTGVIAAGAPLVTAQTGTSPGGASPIASPAGQGTAPSTSKTETELAEVAALPEEN